jgi:hypothetical protein
MVAATTFGAMYHRRFTTRWVLVEMRHGTGTVSDAPALGLPVREQSGLQPWKAGAAIVIRMVRLIRSLNPSVRPWLQGPRMGGPHRRFVPLQALRKAHQLRNAAGLGSPEAAGPRALLPMPHQHRQWVD